MPEIVVVTEASAGVERPTAHAFASQCAHTGVIAHGTRELQAAATPANRWAIVAYIRALQASAGAPIADAPPDERQALR